MMGKRKYVILLIFSIAVMALAVGYLAFGLFQKEPEQTEPEKKPELSDFKTDKKNWPVDFDELVLYNEELIGWIEIPGTRIDDPVARPKDLEHQDFYDSHNWLKKSSDQGCIYMEKWNSSHFIDNKNTVLYGNNCKDGSGFQHLFSYQDSEFMKEHPFIHVYTPYNVLTYEVFAAYIGDDTKLNEAYDFSDLAVFASYLKKVKEVKSMSAVINQEVKVGKDDTILTLSTPTAETKNMRYLVQAVLVKNGSKEN